MNIIISIGSAKHKVLGADKGYNFTYTSVIKQMKLVNTNKAKTSGNELTPKHQ